MRNFILTIFCISILVLQNSAAQSTAENNFLAANDAFAQKNYQAAIQQYEATLAEGFQSAALYFNLGNSYYQEKNWAKAILNYERAQLLSPNDSDISQNLKLANTQTIDEIEIIPNFFLARWWTQVRQLTHSGVWSILAILLLWVSIGGWILWLIGKERQQRKQGFLGGIIALALSILVFALAYSSYQVQQNSGAAIVMDKETPLRNLPDDISESILPLHEGTKVEIMEKTTSWYKVRLGNGEVGWITETALEEI